MRYRVRSLDTGKKIKIRDDDRFIMTADGQVYIERWDGFVQGIGQAYIVEFAFQKKANGKWVWSEYVIH